MNEQDLQLRTKQFALRVTKLIDALPRSLAGTTVAGQLFRAATSVASNYRAACRGRSRAEFVSKLGTVEEESDESAFWLDFINDASLMKPKRVQALLHEANQLTAIMSASRITASRNGRSIANRKLQIANP